jgi:hypothetical protein
VQGSVPLQPPPLQPEKIEPAPAVGVKSTAVPEGYVSEQSAPHVIPAGLLVMVPLPVPDLVTVRSTSFAMTRPINISALLSRTASVLSLKNASKLMTVPFGVALATVGGMDIVVCWPAVSVPRSKMSRSGDSQEKPRHEPESPVVDREFNPAGYSRTNVTPVRLKAPEFPTKRSISSSSPGSAGLGFAETASVKGRAFCTRTTEDTRVGFEGVTQSSNSALARSSEPGLAEADSWTVAVRTAPSPAFRPLMAQLTVSPLIVPPLLAEFSVTHPGRCRRRVPLAAPRPGSSAARVSV